MSTIPEAAVEAAAKVTFEGLHDDEAWDDVIPTERLPYLTQARAALEAAAPILLSHERQQTADAHRDAIVNRDTVDVLQDQLDSARDALADMNERLADAWDLGIKAGVRCDGTHNPYRSEQ